FGMCLTRAKMPLTRASSFVPMACSWRGYGPLKQPDDGCELIRERIVESMAPNEQLGRIERQPSESALVFPHEGLERQIDRDCRARNHQRSALLRVTEHEHHRRTHHEADRGGLRRLVDPDEHLHSGSRDRLLDPSDGFGDGECAGDGYEIVC